MQMSGSRSRGGGGATTRAMLPRKSGASKKRVCERGASCPYLHEHQHTQEFDHDLPFDEGSNRNPGSSNAPTITPFTGEGHRLGGRRSLALPRRMLLAKAVEARLSRMEAESNTGNENVVREQVPSSSLNSNNGKVASKASSINEQAQKRVRITPQVVDLTDD